MRPAVGPMCATTCLIATLWFSATVAVGQNSSYRYVATPTLTFEVSDTPSMHMPTDVAVARDGTVLVADGVNDRVLAFDPTGKLINEIRRVGEYPLLRPIGIDVDGEGRLWIADTGNARILARHSNGSMAHLINLAGTARMDDVDITDIVVSPDGRRVWFADNDNHQIGFRALETGITSRFGKRGESLGQWAYPFMIAMSADETLFVTDVINGRVQLAGDAGQPVGALGTYGLDLGNLYRPTGIAVGPKGNAWVADNTLGVVQVFRPTRELIDVVRDAQGQPLKLDTPSGVDLDSQGALYVVELAAHRVRKFAISVDDAAPRARPPANQVRHIQPRNCTACHVEWMEPIARGQSTAFLAPPENPRDWPYVSRSERCLTCHDGSVADSRRRVWVEHGHQTGIVPPTEVKVPERLPLVDGRMQCRTCHSAHTRGGAGETIARAVFLRVENNVNELCIACHEDMAAGPSAGMHPLARMDQPIPSVLADLGAHVATDSHDVTCLVCHSGHGATSDLLLTLDRSGNELCIACHEQMMPGTFRAGEHALPHPLTADLNDEQFSALDGMNARTGLQGGLGCASCHSMHNARHEESLLAFDLNDSAGCLACHTDKQSMVNNSSHDLRAAFPDTPNQAGVTTMTGGPCSACHMVHSRAQPQVSSALDTDGHCITCHDPSGIAANKTLGLINHPDSRCNDCHDPHETRHGNYLAAVGVDLCQECHASAMQFVGGPHDYSHGAAAGSGSTNWPAASREAGGACLACHKPHGDEESGLYRAGLADAEAKADAACIACHQDAAWLHDSAIAAVHPTSGDFHADHGLPLVTQDELERIGCRTCHDPHAGAWAEGHMLRVAKGEKGESLCIRCHADMQHIEWTGHAQIAGDDFHSCTPCHSTHAHPQQIDQDLLWPLDLLRYAEYPAPDATADRYCVGCHRTDGPAGSPLVASHPPMAMASNPLADAFGTLPLYDESGQQSTTGRITCRTCHLPHGREIENGRLADASLTPAQRRARRAQLRPFQPPNLCSGCHGFDALQRFLYFHDPERRGGQAAGYSVPSIWQPR